ncbi:AAA family ATPase [Methanospirillum hungatei]|uniref:AAA family ATPase n=1 Tax=Methanospirillum hungatei TaxID=2203 RepID=UPI00373AE62B
MYTFQDLIEGGFLYVDKTRDVYELVRYPKGLFFLARPRRFGKSLLLSTIKLYFLGKRDLF